MGCATEGQYRTQLATMVGQSKEALIAKWGKPTGQYTDDSGDEVVAYIKTRDIIVPNTPSYSVSSGGGGMYGGSLGLGGGPNPIATTSSTGMSGGEIHLSCMTKFVVKNGVVISSTFKGNDCKTRNW